MDKNKIVKIISHKTMVLLYLFSSLIFSPFYFLWIFFYNIKKKIGNKYIISLIFSVLISSIFIMLQFPYISSLWIDEWISIKSAEVFFSNNFPYLESGNPLSYGFAYFGLLSIFIKFFNNWIHSGRILNLLLFNISVFLIFHCIKKTINTKIAFWSCVVLLFSNFSFLMVNEIRGYVFTLFLYSILFALFINYKKLNKIFVFLFSLITMAILVDNHITNLLLIAIFMLYFYIYVIFYNRKYKFVLIFPVFLFIILILVSYKGNFWGAINFLFNKLTGNQKIEWLISNSENNILSSFISPYKFLFENTIFSYFNLFFLILSILSCFFILDKRHSVKYIIVALTILLYLIPISLNNVGEVGSRYYFIILPFFSIMLSLGLVTFLDIFKNKKFKYLFPLFIYTIALFSGLYNIQNVKWAKTINFKEIAEIIKVNKSENTFFITNIMGLPIDFYGIKIDFILNEKATYSYYQNKNRFGKTNFMGFTYNAPVGHNSVINAKYIKYEELDLFLKNNKNVIIMIRPWSSDITDKTYKTIKDNNFKNISPKENPLLLFIKS